MAADSLELLESGWTEAHGFFALMGGFMLFDCDQPSRTLMPTELESYMQKGEIMISKEEIKDKSKGDVLSKGLVVVQTGWFILQCMGRGVEHLAITELELVTLAFAALNIATYWFWWNKPLNVQCAFPVLKKPISDQRSEGRSDGVGECQGGVPGVVESVRQGVIAYADKLQGRIRRNVNEKGMFTAAWRGVLHLALKPMIPFILMAYGIAEADIAPTTKGLPTFYRGDPTHEEDWISGLAATTAATIFGAIHCIGWSFQFPSHQEQILWRSSALYITCSPGLLLLLTQHMRRDVDTSSWVAARLDGRHLRRDLGFRVQLVIGLVVLSVIFYILSRATLLIQAFMSLRTLPPSALETVRWTTFIPHI